MDECLDFNLDFLEQNHPVTEDCSYNDLRDLARRINETDNLVQTINSMQIENDILKRQLTEITKSANEVQSMYLHENLRANDLHKKNEELSILACARQKELAELLAERAQKSLYYDQSEENWKCKLDSERERYNTLEIRYNEVVKKCEKQTSPRKLHANNELEHYTSPNSPKQNRCTVKNSTKKRDSNTSSRMVSRGTQYHSSTTTRSTCTSVFIKKHHVSVNFPELVPVSMEDVFSETLVDIPKLLSPIPDICGKECCVETQTDIQVKATSSVGICTDLYNVQNEIDYVSQNKAQSNLMKREVDWENAMKNSYPQLSDLWGLLGRTIFTLIDNSSCGLNGEEFINNIELFRNQINKSEPGFRGTRNSCSDENIPKKELSNSFCNSLDRGHSAHDEFIVNEPMNMEFVISEDKCPDYKIDHQYTSECFQNNVESSFLEEAKVQENLLDNGSGSTISKNELSPSDSKILFITKEFETLERKLVVISPIRDRCALQEIEVSSCNQNAKCKHDYCCETETEKAQTSNAVKSRKISHNKRNKKCKMKRKRFEQEMADETQKHLCIEKKEKLLKLEELTQIPDKCIANSGDESENLSQCKYKENNGLHLEELDTSIIQFPKDSIENLKITVSDKAVNKGSEFLSGIIEGSEYVRHKHESYIRRSRQLIYNSQSDNQRQPNRFMKKSLNNLDELLVANLSPVIHSGNAISNGNCKNEYHLKLADDFSSRKKDIVESAKSFFTCDSSSDEAEFYGFSTEELQRICKDNSFVDIEQESPRSPDISKDSDSYYPKEIPLERQDEYDSDYSPSSPVLNAADEPEAPKRIPLDRIDAQFLGQSTSILKRCIANYQIYKHRLCVKKPTETVKLSKLLWLLRKIIEQYLLGQASQKECETYAKRLAKRAAGNIEFLYTAICEVVEDTNEAITNEYTPPATVMTMSHRKILVLIKALDKRIDSMESKFLFFLDQRIFNLKPDKVQLKGLVNLFLLYIGIIDTQNLEVNPARSIIYKSLYYYTKLSCPLIYYVLASYPMSLPRKDDPDYDNSDPIVSTIQSILNSLEYDMSKVELKHRELFHILRLYYDYDRVKPSREEVVDILISKIRSNIVRNVSCAFALLCKRNGIKWTTNYVIEEKLVPLLNEYANRIDETLEHDGKVACILDCISAVLKPFPITTDVKCYWQMFSDILYSTDRQIIQEAAVLSFLRTARFGFAECFKCIYDWSPTYIISKTVRLSIETFVHRCTLKKLKNTEKQINKYRKVYTENLK